MWSPQKIPATEKQDPGGPPSSPHQEGGDSLPLGKGFRASPLGRPGVWGRSRERPLALQGRGLQAAEVSSPGEVHGQTQPGGPRRSRPQRLRCPSTLRGPRACSSQGRQAGSHGETLVLRAPRPASPGDTHALCQLEREARGPTREVAPLILMTMLLFHSKEMEPGGLRPHSGRWTPESGPDEKPGPCRLCL